MWEEYEQKTECGKEKMIFKGKLGNRRLIKRRGMRNNVIKDVCVEER